MWDYHINNQHNQEKDYFKYNRYMLSPFSKNLFLLSGYIGAVEVKATVRS